jgi:hypothetical protein
MSLPLLLSSAGPPESTSTSTSTISIGLIGSLFFSALTRFAGEGEVGEATVTVTGVPVQVSSFTSAGDGDGDDDGSCFLLPVPAAIADSLVLVWRMNIASMPSLRFCTGSMNVDDSTPTFPTSAATA